MLETSQTIMRVVALTIFTAFFAGLWANDRSTGTVALRHQPLQDPIAQILYGDQHDEQAKTGISPETLSDDSLLPVTAMPAVPMAEPVAIVPTAPTPLVSIQVGQTRKSFFVESDQLQIDEDTLAAHVAQLPLGIAAGDYRIVDAMGGVGWLRVRTDAPPQTLSVVPLISTTVDQQHVQFVKVVQTAAAN